jgi:hypothetical protein
VLSRIRLEASGTDKTEIQAELIEAWHRARDGGEWVFEDEEYIPTVNGYWGRLTMRRKRKDET